MNNTTSDYLEQLQQDKQDLVDNLTEMGIEDLTGEETFTELVPEVLNIETGSDVSEYFKPLDTSGSQINLGSSSIGRWIQCIKKIVNPDIGSGTSLAYVFNKCYAEEYDLSQIDTSRITNMSNMFNNCPYLQIVNLSSFNTSNVTTMNAMFYNCNHTNFKTLNLSNFDFSKINDIRYFIYSTGNLSLQNLTFGINLGKGYTERSENYSNYTLNLSTANNLTHDSLMSVINNLYDLNLTYNVAGGGTLYRQSLVLGSTNLAKLTAEEIAIAQNKGWNVS